MFLKISFFAAFCFAQGFAFSPSFEFRGGDVICKESLEGVNNDFTEVVNQMDEVRESVTMAAIDAYAKGNNLQIVIECFRAQRGSYIALGEKISQMIKAASEEMTQKMKETAEKYAKLMETPLNTIGKTMRDLPELVYNHLKEKEFSKAIEVIRESRKIVRENGKRIGELMGEMVNEVPPMADRVEEMAKEIRNEAEKGSEAIRKAFGRCIEEGGPKSIEQNHE